MRSRDLSQIPPPKPVEPPCCDSCKAFRADCVVPLGEGAMKMCWLCAHQHVDHGVSLQLACEARCECLPMDIYPRSFFGPTAKEFESARDEVLKRRGVG